jgi:urea transporter
MKISPSKLRTPLVLSCAFFFIFAGIALASRLRISPAINSYFGPVLNAEHQSWFEHFLSGFASPSLLFMFVVVLGDALSRGPNGKTNIRAMLDARSRLLSQSERGVYFAVIGACAALYVAVSCEWEFHQFQQSGRFQFGQLSSDIAGSVIWFFFLTRLCPFPRPSLRGQDIAA